MFPLVVLFAVFDRFCLDASLASTVVVASKLAAKFMFKTCCVGNIGSFNLTYDLLPKPLPCFTIGTYLGWRLS
jgi:hypothetical protein